MSFPTQPAYIHLGTWNDTLRAHPALGIMENYTKNIIDGRKFEETLPAKAVHHTPDWTLQKSTGETVEGHEAAWKALAEVYAPFSSHVHDPRFAATWENDKGWEMLGVASLWYNLAAPPSGGEKKMKGHGGKEWDGVLLSAFHFFYVKEGSDVKLARTEIYSDPSAAMVQMLKRGMMKPEQLMD